MRDPASDLDHRGRLIFGGVLAFAVLHALLYILTLPPWDLFDEEQHMSYALYVREEQRIPKITEPIQPEIIDNAAATDRWERFRIGRPQSLAPGEIGLEGRSYEGYQPPLYYLLVSPISRIVPDDIWQDLYAARLIGVFLLFGMASITWGYARDWLRDANPPVWGAAVAAAAAIPAMAGAAARVNNDLLAGLLIATGTMMAARLVEDSRRDEAPILGGLGAAAVLTKSHGVVLLAVIAVALLLLWRSGKLTPFIAAVSLLPGLTALAGWTLFIHNRYGTWTGAGAFLDLVEPFEPSSPLGFLEQLWLNTWTSYWSAYDGGWLRILTGITMLAIVIAGLWWLRANPPRPEFLILTGTLALGLLIALITGDQSGLVHPQGRILLPLIPPLAVLVIGGWSHRFGTAGPLATAAVTVGLSGFFYLYWFYPFFHEVPW